MSLSSCIVNLKFLLILLLFLLLLFLLLLLIPTWLRISCIIRLRYVGPTVQTVVQKTVRVYKIYAFINYNLFRFPVQENTAVGRTSAALRSICPSLSNVSDTVFRNAYYHFEALSDHNYDYFCFRCGHHPPILIWDLCRKGCFPLACK